ncbi:MAG: hypothetical protein JSV49_03965 [Thermoplasmata archaeon]|nr:MAG: hypothetical protein JSV49_03965 [Thermoplasmata archaeon]
MTKGGLWKKIALIALAVLVIYALVDPPWDSEQDPAPTNEEVAETVFEDYGFTFMILALLLAAAMIGGIFIAKIPYEYTRRIEKGKVVEMKIKRRNQRRKRGGA